MRDVPFWLTDLLGTGAGLLGRISETAASWLHESPLFLLNTTHGIAALGLFFLTLLLSRWLHNSARARTRLTDANLSGQSDRSPSSRTASGSTTRSELRAAISSCRNAFIAIGLFSGLINILMLTGAIFMMEIYDRVLVSRSVATLIALAVIAAVLFVAQGVLEFIRGRILSRIGSALDEALSARVFETLARVPLKLGLKGEGHQPVRDLDSIRSFLASTGPAAVFDLPWLPLYLIIIYAFHPLLGITALLGAVVLVGITVITEVMTREPTRAANMHGGRRAALAEASHRNAEVVAAMGMSRRLGAEWRAANDAYLGHQQRASDIAGTFGAISKTLRFMLQSAMLALGAWLVINGQATGGIIIAGSILLGRALAPVDGAIANSKNFVNARQSWARLGKLLEAMPPIDEPLPLHAPRSRLTVANLTLVAPGAQTPLVHDVTFEVQAGQAVGVIGPSGSGKSCLTRAIVGAWQPAKGKVQLDGASLNQWSADAIGRHVGYLRQDVELFAGSIARNIARFEPNADPNAVIAAAQAAGVHDLITSFPNGYETQVGEHGDALSAGQRQRVALARALYGNPFLVVLDEPNSNLDTEGEAALLEAIYGVKARGGVVIVVAHRPNVLAAVDHIVAMQNGRALAASAAGEVYGQLKERKPPLGGPRSGPHAKRLISRDPGQVAKLRRAMTEDRPADVVLTLTAEPADASGKPRLRLAASTPPPTGKSSGRS